MTKKLLGKMVLLLTVLLLVGCNNEEKEIVRTAKEQFRVLYDYEEDKIRPVLEKDLTEEELARKYLLTRLDLEEEEPIYKERGVLPEQGIFIESAIYEGGNIPNITAMSAETAEGLSKINNTRTQERLEKEFKELSEKRQEVLEKQYASDNTGIKDVEEEIRRKVTEYEQDHGEVEKVKEENNETKEEQLDEGYEEFNEQEQVEE